MEFSQENLDNGLLPIVPHGYWVNMARLDEIQNPIDDIICRGERDVVVKVSTI